MAHLNAVSVARAIPIERDAEHARHGSGQQRNIVVLEGADDHGIAGQNCFEPRAVRRIGGAEAQVDDIHALPYGPFDSANSRLDAGRERAVEDFHSVEFGVRRLLADGAGHGGPMAQPVEVVAGFSAGGKADATGDVADVRMAWMDAAVDDGNLHGEAATFMPTLRWKSDSRSPGVPQPCPRRQSAPAGG